jgi:hypothetical protein
LGELDQILATQRLIADINDILNQLVDLFEDHENRLRALEPPKEKLPAKLQKILDKIGKIQDPKKKADALAEFNILYRVLKSADNF